MRRRSRRRATLTQMSRLSSSWTRWKSVGVAVKATGSEADSVNLLVSSTPVDHSAGCGAARPAGDCQVLWRCGPPGGTARHPNN